jgi:hypothetical protein
MKHFFKPAFAFLVLSAAALVLAGCGREKHVDWRQKMVLEVTTPDGVKTGAAVQGVNVQIALGNNANDGSAVAWRITGEAVPVNLGGGKYLFALLTGEKYYSQAGRNAVFAFQTSEKYIVDAVDDVLAAPKNEPKPLTGERIPLLVTFTDINDPKTVTKVEPANLAATFGPGYALKSITLEITDEPVTVGEVEKVLGWVRQYYDKSFRLNGEKCIACPVSSDSLADMVGGGDFMVGLKK